MSDENSTTTGPTRRDTIKYGGSAIGAGLLAGCLGDTGSSDSTPTEQSRTEQPTDTETTTPASEPSYTAELSPVGAVTLDEPPTNVFTHFPWFADMVTALGHGDSINHVWWQGAVSILEYFTAGVDGVDIPWRDAVGSYGFSKEALYERDSDLHLVDPAWVSTQDTWSQDDIDEIAENVGPWFGNYYSNYHAEPPEGWIDSYEYYTLWELFEGVAALYGERSRYAALASLHDDMLTAIEQQLPPEPERPTAAYLSASDDLSSIYVIRLNAPGYFSAHTRPLGAVDAFGNDQWDGAFNQIDLEALLEVDPDVVLTVWGMTSAVDFGTMTATFEADPVGGELSAVQNGRVHAQGTRWQGPLMNLFQLEMTAKQLYPEQFGEWPGYEEGDSYPEFSEEEQLFDRQELADILTGSF